MAPTNVSKLTRAAARGLRSSSTTQAAVLRRPMLSAAARQTIVASPSTTRKFFTTSTASQRGIMPETDDPHPKNNAAETPVTMSVAQLTEGEYHELADEYLEAVLTKLEEAQEEREAMDVEFSSGVMTVTTPDNGTYVINKQPPNKQIWLSSPISGPKRYDYVRQGEGQADKEDTSTGSWVYMRDGSTLDDVFLQELNIDLSNAPSSY